MTDSFVEKYVKQHFPNREEYLDLLNMFFACKQILGASPAEMMRQETVVLRDAYKRDILGQVNKKYDANVRSTYGRFLPMEEMKNNPEFQKQFQELDDLLVGIMEGCLSYYNPAENCLSDAEICFVLWGHPELVKHVNEQSDAMQQVLIKRNKTRYLKKVNPKDVYNMSAAQVQSVPVSERDIDFEIRAFLDDKLSVKDMHLQQLPAVIQKWDKQSPMVGIISKKMIKMVCQIEKLGRTVFSDTALELMRLAFIAHDDYQYDLKYDWRSGQYLIDQSYGREQKPVLAYMKNPISKNVREASIRKNPYTVCEITHQYDAIQELALKVCAEKYSEVKKQDGKPYNSDLNKYGNPWDLQALYEQCLKNPSIMVKRVYEDLQR